MLIEQILKSELRKPGPPAVHVLLHLLIFMTKPKSLNKSSSWSLFNANMLQGAMHLTSIYLGQNTYQI